jgi:hypothetical protein
MLIVLMFDPRGEEPPRVGAGHPDLGLDLAWRVGAEGDA